MKHWFFILLSICALFFFLLACDDGANDSTLPDGDTSVDGDDYSETDGDSDPDADAPRRPIDSDTQLEDLVLQPQPDPPNPDLPDGVTLRVMSYNIFAGRYIGVENIGLIGEMFARYSPDIIGLQECPEDQIAPIAEAAGMPYYGGGGVALLSKTPLEDFAIVPIATNRRYAHAETVKDGTRFSVYCIHLDWNVDGDKQFREFTEEHLELDNTPQLVVMGDCNDEHYSSQINIIETFVSDVFTTFGLFPGERISWPARGFDDTEGSQLIDLIFYPRDYPAIVLNADVLNLAPALSDHKPVIADLLYPIEGAPAFESDPYGPYRAADRDFPPPSNLPPNKLTNPGAEDGLDGWLTTGAAQTDDFREQQSPHNGTKLFTGWQEQSTTGEATGYSSGEQTIDLSGESAIIDAGRGRLYASGYLATGYQIEEADGIVSNMPFPYDDGEIIVDALDNDGHILAKLTSKRRDTLAWHPFYGLLDLPPGTRGARLSWVSHHKIQNGPSNDAVFDDLYLGFGETETPHRRIGPQLLDNPSATVKTLDAWESYGWKTLTDGEVYGLAIFAPRSFTGSGMFYAGGVIEITGGEPSISTLSQTIDLSDYFEVIDAGSFALRWGGWLRSWSARTSVSLSLTIHNLDGSPWQTIEDPAITAAEWTLSESLTKIPPGCSAVTLTVSSNVEAVGSGAFADALFVLPERLANAAD